MRAFSRQKNQCLEKVLKERYGEVRRPSDHYTTPTDFGYTLYFKSPVDYAQGDTWLAAAFVKNMHGPSLEFSDDWRGIELRSDERSTLAKAIFQMVAVIAAQCAMQVGTTEVRCETFPAGERCPAP